LVENRRFEPTLSLFGSLQHFAKIFGIRKRPAGLSYGVVCVILRLAILIQCRRVTDGRMDRQTHDDSIYRASIASRRKNRMSKLRVIFCTLHVTCDVTCGRMIHSSSDDNAIRYILPVLWMTSCFHIMGQNQLRRRYGWSSSPGGATSRRLDGRSTRTRGRRLLSSIALFYICDL